MFCSMRKKVYYKHGIKISVVSALRLDVQTFNLMVTTLDSNARGPGFKIRWSYNISMIIHKIEVVISMETYTLGYFLGSL